MSLSVVLPVFNEAYGIEAFLRELHLNLETYEPSFIVIDDKSADNTFAILEKLLSEGFPLEVHQNELNMGHGYSLMMGLRSAITDKASTIILCDGDGQFDGAEVKTLFEAHINNAQVIVEGARIDRKEFWFRKLISSFTRLLTLVASRQKPQDANTPLRIYSLEDLTFLFDKIDKNCSIPNLALSSISRTLKVPVLEIQVRSLPPRRLSSMSHWKQKYDFLPSKRLIKFSYIGFLDWLQILRTCIDLRKSADKRE